MLLVVSVLIVVDVAHLASVPLSLSLLGVFISFIQ